MENKPARFFITHDNNIVPMGLFRDEFIAGVIILSCNLVVSSICLISMYLLFTSREFIITFNLVKDYVYSFSRPGNEELEAIMIISALVVFIIMVVAYDIINMIEKSYIKLKKENLEKDEVIKTLKNQIIVLNDKSYKD